jgi:hypothetical protein
MTELEQAKVVLGTTSIRATIEQAVGQVNRRAAWLEPPRRSSEAGWMES